MGYDDQCCILKVRMKAAESRTCRLVLLFERFSKHKIFAELKALNTNCPLSHLINRPLNEFRLLTIIKKSKRKLMLYYINLILHTNKSQIKVDPPK